MRLYVRIYVAAIYVYCVHTCSVITTLMQTETLTTTDAAKNVPRNLGHIKYNTGTHSRGWLPFDCLSNSFCQCLQTCLTVQLQYIY